MQPTGISDEAPFFAPSSAAAAAEERYLRLRIAHPSPAVRLRCCHTKAMAAAHGRTRSYYAQLLLGLVLLVLCCYTRQKVAQPAAAIARLLRTYRICTRSLGTSGSLAAAAAGIALLPTPEYMYDI